MSRTTIAFGAALVASAIQFAVADGCQAFQETDRPTVTRAVDVVEPPASRVALGTELTFIRLQTQRAADIHRQGFQIRIFGLREDESLPRPAREIDDCNIYFTNVFTVWGGTSPSIAFDRMDERWMELSNSGQSVRNGHYLLVFEAPGVSDNVFRLRREDAAAYFSTGIAFTIDGAGRADIAKVKAAYAQRKEELLRLQNDLGRRGDQIPCYRYRPFTGAGQYAAAELDDCKG
jgi:hypothetical protein